MRLLIRSLPLLLLWVGLHGLVAGQVVSESSDQTYTLEGRIFDKEIGTEVPYAALFVNSQVGTFADDQGSFVLRGVPCGKSGFGTTLTVRAGGYPDKIIALPEGQAPGSTLTMNIYFDMGPQLSDCPPILEYRSSDPVHLELLPLMEPTAKVEKDPDRNASAATFKIKVRVVDASGKAVSGAKVELSHGPGALTNGKGRALLEDVELGYDRYMSVEREGFLGQSIAFPDSAILGQVWVVDFRLPTDVFARVSPGDLPSVRIFADGYVPGMDKVAPSNMIASDDASLAPILNQIPGLRFEERGPGGSRRLSMRGSLLRSPFGVRNIKVYLDGSPLSSPDGSTPLELADPAFISGIEVLKGPDGSQYGAGTGGTIRIQPFNPRLLPGRHLGAKFAAGSFGYLRGELSLVKERRNWLFSGQYAGQKHDGFRAQEANRKQQAELSAGWLKGKNNLFLRALAYDGKWELPGSLDSLQLAADPRQANAFSLAGDAHVAIRHLRPSISWKRITDNWVHKASAYSHWTDKVNPYATSPANAGYKDEQSAGHGARSELGYAFDKLASLYLGGEIQTERQELVEFVNDGGRPGALLYDADTRSTSGLAFAGADLEQALNKLSYRSSWNRASYRIAEHASPDSLPGSGDFTGGAAFLHSLSFQRALKQDRAHNLRLKASTGYAPPSLWELQANAIAGEGSLLPERAANIEARLQWRRFFPYKGHLNWELQAYASRTQDAILPQTAPSGRVFFANRGLTQHLGLEGIVVFQSDLSQNGFVDFYSLGVSGVVQNYTFLEYQKDGGADLSGNRLPGIPPWTLRMEGRMDLLDRKFSVSSNCQWNGRIPLDDENSVFQGTYAVWEAQLTYQWVFWKNDREVLDERSLLFFLGGRNLLNSSYSSFLQLNAFGGRYWNPANARSVYGGIEIAW